MKTTIELKALGSNREISSLRIWAFRLYMLIAIPNAIVAAYGSGGVAGLAGGLIAITALSGGLLYLLTSPPKQESQPNSQPTERATD